MDFEIPLEIQYNVTTAKICLYQFRQAHKTSELNLRRRNIFEHIDRVLELAYEEQRALNL